MRPFTDNDPHHIRYVQDLADALNLEVANVILEVFNGVARSMGIEDPDKLAAKPPQQLAKGYLGGMREIAKKLKKYFNRKRASSPLVLRGNVLYRDGKPLTVEQWRAIEDQIGNYMRKHLDSVAEEAAVKAILLGLASAEADQQAKYGERTLEQIEKSHFNGYIPDSEQSATRRYKLSRDVKSAITAAKQRAAQMVQTKENGVKEAIRMQVVEAVTRAEKEKPRRPRDQVARELASDLYWMREDKPELKRFTAEAMMRDWQRVALTETAMIHESGKLAATEHQAREAKEDPDKAVYFAFVGPARCDDCRRRLGTIAKQVPADEAGDRKDDRIVDEYASITTWIGKSNFGRKKADWWTCTPLHPRCDCTWVRIYPDSQQYDPKTKSIRFTGGEQFRKFLPKRFVQELDSMDAKVQTIKDLQTADRARGIHRPDSYYYKNYAELTKP